MIAIDTSALIAFFSDSKASAVNLVAEALDRRCAVFPPVVLTEILSDHRLHGDVVTLLEGVPLLTLKTGFWSRAGKMRAYLLSKGRKARLADCLISQSCLDHNVPLITLDRDFRVFEKHFGLRLL